MAMLYKTERKCYLIDIVVPWDKKIDLKKQEKVYNYCELRREVKKTWNLSQVVVAPVVVIGALGVTSKRLKDWLKKSDEEQQRAFEKSNIDSNCKNCKVGHSDLRLLGATYSLRNIPKNRDKHNNNNNNNNNNSINNKSKKQTVQFHAEFVN